LFSTRDARHASCLLPIEWKAVPAYESYRCCRCEGEKAHLLIAAARARRRLISIRASSPVYCRPGTAPAAPRRTYSTRMSSSVIPLYAPTLRCKRAGLPSLASESTGPRHERQSSCCGHQQGQSAEPSLPPDAAAQCRRWTPLHGLQYSNGPSVKCPSFVREHCRCTAGVPPST
jgi:hypothetical protein